MKRRAFIHDLGHTLGAAAAGGLLARFPQNSKKLDRIGLELYAVRHAMAQDPERTLAAIRAIGYTDVELLWSFNNFNRTPAQVAATLKNEGLRAPSCHMSADTIFVGWQRSLDIAKQIGHEYLFVPDFEDWTKRTIDDWLEWADKFNAAGAVARRSGIWLGFHNEPYHQKPIDGKVPYDAFIGRLDPSVTRLQLDVGNMLMGGGDPMAYLQKYPDRFWSFHLKDTVADRSSDTRLGTGIFDFKHFLAAVPSLNGKPAYVEDESPADELAAARSNFQYLQGLEF
ncbi:MAG TPA: sugar phosphate isomerase/epimerase [Gemmatimonadales bacterium]|jgi:sugar phosphate isomerase/epimerase|nr:sugar phosphate isomerase/epimerase [Gemmatimonadales bacterium]